MSKKTLILTQKQLDEIVGGNSAYLDNVDSDFVQDGANKVYTGEKTDSEDTKPVTSDKFAKQINRNYGYYGYGRTVKSDAPLMMTCSKAEWKKRNLVKEDNQDLVGTNFGIGQSVKDNMVAAGDSAGANAVEKGNVSYGNAKVIKHRMEKLQKQAQKGDVGAQQKYQNMGGKLLQDTVTNKLDTATSLDKRDKENRSNMGFQNVYQKSGGTKISGNGKANSPKQVITYENKITEGKSIKSKKLLDILSQHGGFYKEPYLRGRKDNHDIRMTNADLHNLTDEQVIDVVDWEQIKPTIENIRKNKLYGFIPGDDVDYVQLNDNKYLLLLVKNAHQYNRERQVGDFQDLIDKKNEREKNTQYTGKHNNSYNWKSKDAQYLAFENPWYKDWDEESKERLRKKIKDDYKK